MPAYAFTARGTDGRTLKGLRAAGTEGALADELLQEGFCLIRAEAARPVPHPGRNLKLKAGQVIPFLLHLAAYLEAGLTLPAALRDFHSPDLPRLQAAVEDMAVRIAEGAPLSAILEGYPELFQPVHVGMVRAGEAGGRLEAALRQVIRLMEWNSSVKAQVRRAATYPLILLALLVAILLLVCTYSLPPILVLMEDLGVPLPAVTKIFLGLGRSLGRYGWLALPAALALGAGFRAALRRPGLRLRWDTFLLDLPLVGPLVTRTALARFAHTLGAQYGAGVPLVEALRTAEGVTGNARLAQAVASLRAGVRQGGRLSDAAAGTGRFPPLVIRMLALGEETGSLEETLERVAARFDADVRGGVESVFQVLDPLLKVLMAGLVIFVATSVLLPLYLMIGAIHGQG